MQNYGVLTGAGVNYTQGLQIQQPVVSKSKSNVTKAVSKPIFSVTKASSNTIVSAMKPGDKPTVSVTKAVKKPIFSVMTQGFPGGSLNSNQSSSILSCM